MAPLDEFLGIHDRLERLFAAHQELLLRQRLDDARTALDVYRTLMVLHMRHEEQCLLPVYAELGPNPAWPLRLYTGQHRRMRELLAAATERIGPPSGEEAGIRRSIIALLDYEATYKHLVVHHEGAERQGLFAALEFELNPSEQANLFGPCISEWRHAEHVLLGTRSNWPLELPRPATVSFTNEAVKDVRR
jgi:hypothetical protein